MVLGATGFTGAEVTRLLSQHPAFDLVALSRGTSSAADRRLPHVDHVDLVDLDAALDVEADVCFSCLPGDAALPQPRAEIIVDLSDRHRGDPGWTYGLTEWVRPHLSGCRAIANPGCYPTAVALCLLPFAKHDLVHGDIVVDALSGYSGAGRQPADHLLLAVGAGDAAAYGTPEHRHVGEIERALKALGGLDAAVSFTPHLVPMGRGLLVTVRARVSRELADDEALEVLHDAYGAEPFVRVTHDWPRTKATHGSNSALVSARVDQRTGWLIASAALDNLGKGAAGQAVQNANLATGIEEVAGLARFGVWP